MSASTLLARALTVARTPQAAAQVLGGKVEDVIGDLFDAGPDPAEAGLAKVGQGHPAVRGDERRGVLQFGDGRRHVGCVNLPGVRDLADQLVPVDAGTARTASRGFEREYDPLDEGQFGFGQQWGKQRAEGALGLADETGAELADSRARFLLLAISLASANVYSANINIDWQGQQVLVPRWTAATALPCPGPGEPGPGRVERGQTAAATASAARASAKSA